MTTRKTPRPKAWSFYLGKEDIASQRALRLDKKAKDLGLENRSELIQLIADGKLEVRRREPQSA